MKEKLFKHLLNVTTGAACAAMLMGTLPITASVLEKCISQETELQTASSQETDENKDTISPQNDMDKDEFQTN